MAGPITDAEFRRCVLAIAPDRTERHEPVRRETYIAIAAILVATPGISANAVAAQVFARRSDVLEIVREIREPAGVVPDPGNHTAEVGS